MAPIIKFLLHHILLFLLNDERVKEINNLKKSFQAGVNTLYNKCVSLGFTPAGKTPTNISNTISKIYTDRYNTGHSVGYTSGYSDGRIQGQKDVKNNPGAYGISPGFYWDVKCVNDSRENKKDITLSAGTHKIAGVSMRYGNYQPSIQLYYNGSKIFDYICDGPDQSICAYDSTFTMPASGTCSIITRGVTYNSGMTYLTISIV